MSAYGGKYDNTTEALSLTTATPTQVPLDLTLPAEDITYGTANSVTIGTTGVYELNYGVTGSSSVATDLTVAVRNNGAALTEATVTQSLAADTDTNVGGSSIVNLTAGDVLDLSVTSSNTGDFTLSDGVNARLVVKRLN